ncbi:CLUMA_CG002124, isoform A [Clunio marinus]|uniref:CLUMA_CG002124, isoform A n=1 Tax=Clunio marinus TaxID=568069 RepID=A0A1J1HLC4_9DIPT|nr:CLUMA_CG002124, isoform A [Clunio marinus]
MENKENSSNNNWLTLLRKKIHKKFKRNSQKLENSASLDIIDEAQQETSSTSPGEMHNNIVESNQCTPITAQDCEEMKKELFKLSWYWPKLTMIEAQKLLSQQPNGSFLVRDSSEKDSFTLSFRTNSKTFHCRNQWSQILASKSHTSSHSLIDVIEDTIKKSQSSVVGFIRCDSNDVSFPTSYAVRLIYPICRKISVPSLQSLCLSKIKSKVNQSNINSLPLPPKIKEYVRENYNTL